jgi:hypothetical protein
LAELIQWISSEFSLNPIIHNKSNAEKFMFQITENKYLI